MLYSKFVICSTALTMRIAIIGCGYVGSALGKVLAASRHDVVGTTTTSSRVEELRPLGVRPELLDIADVGRLHQILGDREVVYLTLAPGQRGVDYRDVYLAAAESLIKATTNTPVRRIIHTSSTRVYGHDDGTWVDESSPTGPMDENGRVLLQTEETLLQQSPTTVVTVLRLGGIYGPGRDYARRIRSLAGTKRSDGDLYGNLIHLDDIVGALVALLDVAYHGVLNLVDDRPEQRRILYDRILNEAGLPAVRWVHDEQSASLGKRVRNDLIKRTLNLELKYPMH